MTHKKEVSKEVSKEAVVVDSRINQQQVEKLRAMPVIETKIRTSEDGKWIIQETIIKSIKPVNYYKAMMNNEGGEAQ